MDGYFNMKNNHLPLYLFAVLLILVQYFVFPFEKVIEMRESSPFGIFLLAPILLRLSLIFMLYKND